MPTYTCPVCHSDNIEIFIEIPRVPVYCNVIWETKKEAVNAPTAKMRLGFCNACSHIYNYDFDPGKLDYSLNYENALHFSERFRQYEESMALEILERYALFEKDIIEIGCGDGHFLKLLCELGNNRGVGFDPSHSAKQFSKNDGSAIEFIHDFYSERYLNQKADFICCRHVLEHIQYPFDFLRSVRRAIGKRSGIVVFFEVPNALYTVKDLGIWDLIYEHCSYFTTSSLKELFISCAFKVVDTRDFFEGQFLCIEAKPVENGSPDNENNKAKKKEISDYVRAFAVNYSRSLNYWESQLDAFNKKSQKTVVWGAGSKGATFLNNLKNADAVEYLVDINPRKHGKFIPGSGQKIISPEELKKYTPDIAIVMNPVYLKEIEQIINQMNLKTKLISVNKTNL